MEENDFSIMGLSFLGAGEVITTAIYERLIFGESGRGAISPADRDSYDQLPEFLTRGYIALSPGYYAGLPGGIIATWGRGYSDATATRIHDTIHELFPDWTLTLAIRKMYPICSADPRRIDIHRVKKLAHISLKLLLEMIGTHGASGQFINQNAANPLFFENG